MEKSQKRPSSYADLSLVQLKTFADRGDDRAKEELGRRMGMGMKSASASPVAAKQKTSGLQPKETAGQFSPANRPAPQALVAEVKRPVQPDHVTSPTAANQPKVMPPLELPPEVVAALRRTEGLAPPPERQPSSADILNNLLINDALGASGNMSPNLLAKLEEIAQNAPDEDIVHPPVYLGLGMILLGLLVGVFGFSVTKGDNGTWYFVACGFATAVSGWLYCKGMRLALPVYAVTCIMTAAWALYEAPLLQAVLTMFVPLAIAGYAFHPFVRDRLER